MDKNLLIRYFTGSCSQDELASVLKWFDDCQYNNKDRKLIFSVLEALNPECVDSKDVNFNAILEKLHYKIIHREIDKKRFRLKTNKQLFTIFSKIAAILLLPLLSFGLIMSIKYQTIKSKQQIENMAFNEVSSSVDAITKVLLPDGSNVWLNHSSTLRYPAAFMGKSRNVELRGEGYFEVVSDSAKPFIVSAGDIRISALGTTFNVLAYPEEDMIITSLIKGKVNLERIDDNGKIRHFYSMAPLDFVSYRKSQKQYISGKITDDRCFSWKSGKLVFKNETMGNAVVALSRWFNVDIEITDAEIRDITVTATFLESTLTQVMDILKKVAPIDYTIIYGEKLDDDTFRKPRVLLKYRR